MDYPNRENFYHKTSTVKKDVPCDFVRDSMTGKFRPVYRPREEDSNMTETTARDTNFDKVTTTMDNTVTPQYLYTNAVPSEENKPVEKVNHPSHYNSVKKETIKILDDYLTDEEYDGFLKGNVIKYMHRYKFKNGVEDLQKAKWYLEELIRENTK